MTHTGTLEHTPVNPARTCATTICYAGWIRTHQAILTEPLYQALQSGAKPVWLTACQGVTGSFDNLRLPRIACFAATHQAYFCTLSVG